MTNIAAISTNDETMLFNLFGIKTIKLEKNEEPSTIKALIEKFAENDFTMILVEEKILAQIPEIVLKYKDEKTPSIVALPTFSKIDEKPVNSSVLEEISKKITGAEITF